MRQIAIIGLAVVGLMTLGIDYFFLESFAVVNIEEARKELWMKAGIAYLILLIPPFLIIDRNRRDKTRDVLSSVGFVALEVSQYIGIGFLLYVGWYLAITVFTP